MSAKRLLLVASGGGHWVQLARMSPAFDGHKATYVTTLPGTQPPSPSAKVALICDASRSKPHLLILLFFQLLWIVIRVRPEVAVSTGAAPGLLAIQISKLFGAKTIWIDSIANSEELSLSGRLAGRYADVWLTQWPHLTGAHPGLTSYGGVL